MTTLKIRNIDEAVKTGLRMQAAAHGHSMEEEARQILKIGIQQPYPQIKLGSRIHERFADLGCDEFALPERSGIRLPPDFSET